MATEAETTTDRRAVPARRRTIPLSGTLAVVMAGLVALTTIDVLAVFWCMTAGTTRDLLVRTAQLGLDSVQARIGDRFTPVEDQLAFLAREIASGRVDPADGVALERLMTGALAGTPQVRVLSLTAPDGKIRGVTQGPHGVFAFTDTIRTDNERHEIDAARGSDEAIWGPVYFVPAEAMRTSVANLRRPVQAEGRFAGVLRATITVDALSDHLRTIAEANPGTTPFILYGRDRVLAHPAMATQRPALSPEHPLPSLDEVGDRFLAALWTEDRPDAVEGDLEVRVVRLGDDGRVILTRTIDGYAPAPLIVGVEVPVAVLDKPDSDLLRAGLAGLAVLAIAIGIAILVSRAIARPVGAMAREVRAVGSLDFASLRPLPGSLFSELNEQARAYNTMLTGLRWLETYVPKALVRRLLRSGGAVPSAERMVTVMFTDIVDFTATAERMPAAEVASMLNAHFDLLGRCVEAEGGTIDKFIGDCVMAFWGAPDDQPDHADRALRAARAIAAAVAADNAARRGRGLAPLRLRIGIHSGRVVAGNIGMSGRSGYTIVGDAVNLGNRLEQLGKAVAPADEIVVLASGETVALAADDRSDLRSLGARAVPGRRMEIEIFRLEATKS
ncbi:adenylate/guanylate cyclase domain-containing protein [Inquilinus sp. Marseille-Q2685]|uniref:adenylate/guanylate cyclase domain-containing protein n=1 Tax=Inquilinus sp. Marseille-Q2685 TaxID=2866581 RepID=UPI001CE4B50E|nr:adenylate/guanylate cyclase domain-containing protein [Inquilinus sp. Marseille-Q2685]